MTDSELPDAEFDVMSCLWNAARLTAKDIREELVEQRPMSHASVCTLLKRLEGKGLVKRTKAPSGKAFLYSACVSPTKTRKRMVRDLVDRVFSGSGVALVASLLQTRKPSEAEIEELQELLDELKKKRKTRS